jgi:hypothetical protein
VWNKLFSIESLQLAAVLTFIRFAQSNAPEMFAKDKPEKTTPQDIAALRKLLPLADVEQIVREKSCEQVTADDGSSTLMAIELSSPEELNDKLKELVGLLVTRLISNMFAFGAKLNFLDVAFDDDEDSFVFSLTEKGRTFYQKYQDKLDDDTDVDD